MSMNPSPREARVSDRRCSRAGRRAGVGSGEARMVGLSAVTATTERTMAGLRMVAVCEVA